MSKKPGQHQGVEIGFAYSPFKWENNAKKNAGVSVVVIGMRQVSSRPRYIFSDGLRLEATHINGYLTPGSDVIVAPRRVPLSALPTISNGSMPNDDGNLLLSLSERAELIGADARAARHIRAFTGTDEFIDGVPKFAVWVTDEKADEAMAIPLLATRIERVRSHRLKSSRNATLRLAATPWRFAEVRYRETEAIVIPRHSSERRDYIPMGYVGPELVVGDSASAVYGAEPWVFALLTSRMHMVWARAVGGALETRIRYSNTIIYNNFPVPVVVDEVKERLTIAALRVLDAREYHCERTLAELYDPEEMPTDLRVAHAYIDVLVDSLYSKRTYSADEQRLSDLFAMYEKMTVEEPVGASSRKVRGRK